MDKRYQDSITTLIGELQSVEKVQALCYRMAGNLRESIQSGHVTASELPQTTKWMDWFMDLATSLNKYLVTCKNFPETPADVPTDTRKIVDKDAN